MQLDKRRVTALLLLSVCLVSAAVGITVVPRTPFGGITGGKIAVISIEGPITDSSGLGLFGPESSATDIARQIKRAGEDPSVKAIIMRINSPGGSAAASQEIYQEVIRAKDNGKVVVASMGDSATSGGYYVACAADKIMANPGTITGSIGVIISQLQYSELMEKYGIEANTIKSGEYKDIGSPYRNMTDEEEQILQDMVDDIFDQFVNVVVEGRDMNRSEVTELADGRVFTGRQAQELGLVDHLGNYYEAIDLAANMSGIENPQVIEYGGRSPFQSILGLFGRQVGRGMAEIFIEAGKQEIKFGEFT